MFSKINRLDRAIQAAQRHQVRRGLPVELTEQIVEEAGKIEARLTKLIADANTAKQSGKYSPAGLAEKVATFQQEAKDAYAKLNKLESFDAKIVAMDVDLINRSVTERRKHTPADPTLSYHQEREMRQWALEERKRAEAAKEPGKPYSDPVEALFMQCCSEYDSTKEQLIRAIIAAPFPITLLPAETISQGIEILQRTISPELATALDSQKCLKAMYQELDIAVQEILADPLRQGVVADHRIKVVADGGDA